MEHKIEDEGLIRRYLLGGLAEDELQLFERRMMADSELFDRVLLAEDEMVDEYVEGKLSERERKRFEASFLSTLDGIEQVSLAKALRKYVSTAATAREPDNSSKEYQPLWPRQLAFRSYMRLAAAAVLLLLLGLGIWQAFFYQSEVTKGIAALSEAYRKQRPLEARISGLRYAPVDRTRGGQENVDQASRDRAERILLDAVFEHPGPASHHALAKLYLSEKKFDQAVAQFEEALKTDPNNAYLHSDYGAALLELGKADQVKGGSGRGLEYLAKSLERFDRALKLNDSLLEALFNRALCLQHMNLLRQATDEWKNYLEKDPDSNWAEEARQNIILLEGRGQQSSQNREQLFQDFLTAYENKDEVQAWKLLNHNREMTGSFLENKLIDDYLDLVAKGRGVEARERLDLLSYASDLEYRQAGDKFIHDLVRSYKMATPAQRKSILQARGWTKSGYENFNKSNFEEALKLYNRAKETFEQAADSCETMYVNYLIGYCYLHQSNSKPGLEIFRSLTQSCERYQYKGLLAKTLGAIAYANQDSRDFSEAISNSTRAMKLSEEMGDKIGYAAALFQLADEYRFINNYQKALDLHAQALSLALVYLPQPALQWRNYYSISLTLDNLGEHAAAICFQKEALQLAIEGKRPRLICRSYNHLGRMIAKSGDYVEAVKNIERALEIADSFPEKRIQVETKAYCFLHLGNVYRKSGDYNKAIEDYDQAIQNYDQLDSEFFNYTAWKEKLICCMEQDGCPLVEQELERLLNLFEQHRWKILEESNRNTFFDGEQSIYDVAIEFGYSKKGDPKKAFDYSERSHARSLRDSISTSVKIINELESPDIQFGGVSQPMGVEEIQARMPEKAQILQYAVLKDKLLIWVVSKQGFFSKSQQVAAVDLSERVRNYIEGIYARHDSVEVTSREAAYLYELLIKPVEGMLDRDKQLCIVPDKVLNYLPFAALVNGDKYFIEEYSIVLSPSANVFILCSEVALEKSGARIERLLSVGNPAFDANAFSNLADLPSAAIEAEAIARYYESPGPLIGRLATESRVKSEMEKADVIHLAMHAIAEEWNPMRSKLLLAKDVSSASEPDLDGVLQAHEIYNRKLERARLVVLSACRTGVEKYYGGEGMIGLSRPFMAKRIPLVVASLWPVDSDSTARLMISFHRYRKSESMPTAEALRQAQIEMIRNAKGNDRLPYNWASFVAIGGYTSY